MEEKSVGASSRGCTRARGCRAILSSSCQSWASVLHLHGCRFAGEGVWGGTGTLGKARSSVWVMLGNGFMTAVIMKHWRGVKSHQCPCSGRLGSPNPLQPGSGGHAAFCTGFSNTHRQSQGLKYVKVPQKCPHWPSRGRWDPGCCQDLVLTSLSCTGTRLCRGNAGVGLSAGSDRTPWGVAAAPCLCFPFPGGWGCPCKSRPDSLSVAIAPGYQSCRGLGTSGPSPLDGGHEGCERCGVRPTSLMMLPHCWWGCAGSPGSSRAPRGAQPEMCPWLQLRSWPLQVANAGLGPLCWGTEPSLGGWWRCWGADRGCSSPAGAGGRAAEEFPAAAAAGGGGSGAQPGGAGVSHLLPAGCPRRRGAAARVSAQLLQVTPDGAACGP